MSAEPYKPGEFSGMSFLSAPDEKQKIATLAILCVLAMSDGVLAGEEKAILQMYMDNITAQYWAAGVLQWRGLPTLSGRVLGKTRRGVWGVSTFFNQWRLQSDDMKKRCRQMVIREKRIANMPGDHLFFLAMPQITQRIPIPRTGKNGATGAFVGGVGILTITTTGAGVGSVENTAGVFTEEIVTPVLGLMDSACAWHWPL